MNTANPVIASSKSRSPGAFARAIHGVHALFARIPEDAIKLLARISLAVTFWASGQTKVEGLVLDPIGWNIELRTPHVSEGAIELFRSEYALPWIDPTLATYMAAIAEHVLPLLLLFGLATRLSAFSLLVMTLVIQVFVYPSAYPTHGLWAALLLYLMARGPGAVSVDRLIARRHASKHLAHRQD